jgi:hypothetical protein
LYTLDLLEEAKGDIQICEKFGAVEEGSLEVSSKPPTSLKKCDTGVLPQRSVVDESNPGLGDCSQENALGVSRHFTLFGVSNEPFNNP